MGSIDNGDQQIDLDYKAFAKAININKNFYNIVPTGFYTEPSMSINSDTIIEVSPFNCFIKDDINAIGLKISTTTNAVVTVSTALPYVVFRYTWVELENNYGDFVAVELGDILETDLVVGECLFTGITLVDFDYSLQTTALIITRENTSLLDSGDSEPTDLVLFTDISDANILKTETKDDFFDDFSTILNSTIEEKNKIIADFLIPLIQDTGIDYPSSDIGANDSYGFSTALSKDNRYAVIGAATENSEGAVYVFGKTDVNTWVELVKLVASDRENGANFGVKVSISDDGEYIAVGALSKDDATTDDGAVYVFRDDGTETWSSLTKILAVETGKGFGVDVKLNSDASILVVGAYDSTGATSGKAYSIARTGVNTWGTPFAIVPSEGVPYDNFGLSVDIIGNYIAIGASAENVTSTSKGKVYVYEQTSPNVWGNEAILEMPALFAAFQHTHSYFGQDVSLDQETNYLIVGGPNCRLSSTPTYTGAIFIYKRTSGNTWDTGNVIATAPDDDTSWFGLSVQMQGDYILAGAPLAFSENGYSYLYRLNKETDIITFLKRFESSSPSAQEKFGWSVALSNKNMCIGKPNKNSFEGATDIFQFCNI